MLVVKWFCHDLVIILKNHVAWPIGCDRGNFVAVILKYFGQFTHFGEVL
jgi:hypothetical protein